MIGQPMPAVPGSDSVAAMMRRGMSLAESHLILAPARFGAGKN
jgi:hypothetical protein